MTATAEQLRVAAIEHASIPVEWPSGRRPHSPLVKLIPDGTPVTRELADVVESITGRPLVADGEMVHIFAPMPWTIPARSRAALNRWAVREHGDTVRHEREHIEARNLYRELVPGKSGIVR